MSHKENELIQKHMGLVRRQALRMLARVPPSVSLDDLMQAGLIGLLSAIRLYQEQADAQFETYAVTRIRGALLDELRNEDWLSRRARSKARQIESTMSDLRHTLGREPNESELANALGLSLSDYQQMLHDVSGTQVVHLGDMFRHTDHAGADPLDVLSTDQVAPSYALRTPQEHLTTQALRQCLIEAIKSLPEREQLLLSLQFEHDLNQKEIAAVMEVSEGRISQLRSQAISRIRSYLQTHHWERIPQEVDIETLL